MPLSRTLLVLFGLLLFLAGVGGVGYGVLTIVDLRGYTEPITGVVLSADAREARVTLSQEIEADGPRPPLSFSGEVVVSQSRRNPRLVPGDRLTLYHPPHWPNKARADLSVAGPLAWAGAGAGIMLLAALLIVMNFREKRAAP